MLRQVLDQPGAQFRNIQSVQRAQWHHLRIGQRGLPKLQRFQHFILVALVHLVQQQQRLSFETLRPVQHFFRSLRRLPQFHQHDQDVGIGQRLVHRLHHALVHLVLRIENARRIAQDQLVVVAVEDAQDPVARGLRLRIGDHQLLADQRVQQGALAHVGFTYDVHVSCLVRHLGAQRYRVRRAGLILIGIWACPADRSELASPSDHCMGGSRSPFQVRTHLLSSARLRAFQYDRSRGIPFSKLFRTFAVHCGVEQMVARRAHNPKAAGSSPAPATKKTR